MYTYRPNVVSCVARVDVPEPGDGKYCGHREGFLLLLRPNERCLIRDRLFPQLHVVLETVLMAADRAHLTIEKYIIHVDEVGRDLHE